MTLTCKSFMKNKRIFWMVCSMWTFLFTIMFGMKASSANTFTTPDFAFPKEVATNAKSELDRSLKNGDNVTALRAAMQIVVADNLVSSNNFEKGVALFDSLSNTLKSPYSAVAALLEARLLSDAYKRDQWTYNNRVLPLDSFPKDIKSWSKDLFMARVTDLIKLTGSSYQRSREMAITSIAPILSDYEAGEKAGMSLYDFMVIQSSSILRPFETNDDTIPFNNLNSPSGSSRMPLVLIDENVDWNIENKKFEMGALVSEVKLKLLSGSEKNSWNETCLKRFQNTPWGAPFLLYKVNQGSEEENLKANYHLVNDYLQQFPDCLYRDQLESYLAGLLSERINVEGQSQYLPGKEIKGKVKFNNLSEFYLLVVKLPNSFLGKNIKKENLLSSGNVVASCKISGDNEEPSYSVSEFSFDSLTPGVYAFVPSRSTDKSGIIWYNSVRNTLPTFLVSSLSAIQSSDNNEGNFLFVVEGANQKPVKGASVRFTPAYKWKNAKVVNAVTDAEGMVKVPEGSYKVFISHGKNQLDLGAYSHISQESRRTVLRGEILTDLSIYHPGDTVRFSVVAYTSKGENMRAANHRKIKIQLLDVNWQPKDTVELTTDEYGRCTGNFPLPESGLLGLYRLQLTDENSNWAGETAVQVSDYKSPTFYIETTGGEGAFSPGEVIKLHGVVKTYSGMPLDSSKVKYQIRYQPVWWWRDSGGPAGYGGETLTDPDGSFIISLPTEGLRNTRFAVGRYTVNIEVTDQAGETQMAAPLVFSMGSAWQIRPSIPRYLDADKSTEGMKVAVYDVAGFPAIKKIWYKINNEKGETIDSGEFESPVLPYNFSSLPSGEYKIIFSLDPEFGDDDNIKVSSDIVVYREWDKEPAEKTPLWLAKEQIIVPADTKTVKIRVGSSYSDSYLLAEVSDMNRILERRWLKVSEGFISLPVAAPSEDSRLKVTFAGMHDLEGIVKSVTLVPEIQTKKLEVVTESFRDRTSPGSSENWKFQFLLDGSKMSGLPVMAVMSNKALNALRPFKWNLDPYSQIGWYFPANISQNHNGNYYWNMMISKPVEYTSNSDFVWPQFDTYGYSLYGGYGYNGIKIRGASRKMAKAGEAVINCSAVKNEVYEESAEVMLTSAAIEEDSMALGADADQGEGVNSSKEEEPLREVECALAFFKADLLTDEDGMASMDFVIPDFNGTWQFQIAGYTPEMKGAVLVRDVLSAKAVMVSLNAPRFVRTSDRVSISGRLFNNGADSISLGGEISVFDPLTGKDIATKEFEPELVKAMGSRKVEVAFDVPSEIEMLGIRLIGITSSHRDGEQTIIPVLPSSTPVTEAQTFYLSPGEKEILIPGEKYDSGSVTLTYTDNPVWECVSELPSIVNTESKNALSLADALYGNGISMGLLETIPELREALQIFSDPKNSSDSTLISKLERNSTLKTVSLDNTPWVRDAQSQTLRMSKLHYYLNRTYSEKIIKEATEALKKLQNSDGGWSWCEGMESSGFVTRYVLSRLAMLSKAGFLTPAARSMALSGVGFADADYVKEYERIGSKRFIYSDVADYLFIRNMFGDIKGSVKFDGIKKMCLQTLAKEWKKTSIRNKATAASLLYRAGKTDLANEILRSLGEYSSYSKSQGRWFDNLGSGWQGISSIETTSRVLEVMAEVRPDSEMIDQLRQWLLLSLQTGDWNAGSRSMTQMIHAILTTGSKWTGNASKPRIFIGDREIQLDKVSQLTGSLILSMEDEEGNIKISRDAAGPAWGGIISQYVAPIVDVKAVDNDRLSIEKAIFSVHTGSKGTIASGGDLKVGDKVRITLTIKNDRDLEYIAVTDSRATCLEPAEMVSGYAMSDGIMMYKEIRNDATNLFIPYLPKGTHVVNYECFVDREGDYSLGIATAQSQYSPEIVAHSAGRMIKINQAE